MIRKAFEIKIDKRDKGTWIINSGMNIQLKGGALKSREMILYINRNTRTTKGYFTSRGDN